MNTQKFSLGLLVLASTYLGLSQSYSKEQTLEWYQKWYKNSFLTSTQWKGNLEHCEAGTVPVEVYEKALYRINFFRKMNHLPLVTWHSEWHTKAQAAALIMAKNNRLSHAPNSSWLCWTALGLEGAQKSNLGLVDFVNFPDAAFITHFIKDYGDANYYVGHRRWLLYSKLNEIAYGAVNDRSEVLLTLDGVIDTPHFKPEYIAYPWAGCVPAELIFPKWSFALPEGTPVDFSKATVHVKTKEGKAIALKQFPVKANYLDPTLVWEMTGLFSSEDIKYSRVVMNKAPWLNQPLTVTISNVQVEGRIKNFSYTVTPIVSD